MHSMLSSMLFLTNNPLMSWDGSASCNQVIGEQALVDILDLSELAWTCRGCFYTQQWAGAEDAAGTGNE